MWKRLGRLVGLAALVAVMAGCAAAPSTTEEPVGGGGGGGGTATGDVTASPVPSPFASPQGTGDQTTGDKGTGSKGGTDIPKVPQTQP
jgi:hypothetical protein